MSNLIPAAMNAALRNVLLHHLAAIALWVDSPVHSLPRYGRDTDDHVLLYTATVWPRTVANQRR